MSQHVRNTYTPQIDAIIFLIKYKNLLLFVMLEISLTIPHSYIGCSVSQIMGAYNSKKPDHQETLL